MSAVGAAPGYLRADTLLSVRDLICDYRTAGGTVRAVAGVSFDVRPGETLGLVGESGCGKTTTGRAVLRLLPITAGSIEFEGRDLATLGRRELREVRQRLQTIFQDALSAFNPRRRVRDIVAEGLAIAGRSRQEISKRVDAVLAQVGLSAQVVGDRRAHEFSGGQCQRIGIARALAVAPRLIVCDEPVASLDVSIQAQVLNVLHEIRQQNDLAMVFISHDLAVVRNVSDRIAVMYLGKIVEIAESDHVYSAPAHPYTRALLNAVPDRGHVSEQGSGMIPGEAPSAADPPSGCRFRTRCPLAQPVCAEVEPQLAEIRSGQFAACHFPLSAETEGAA